MSKITPESIAELKALFNDNNKALSANYSQLIDFFNDNKVTDNGDGTYTVGEVTIDANSIITSDDISANVNSVINQKDLATQKYVDDEVSKIPQPDLSNYATQQQLATKADADSIGLVNLIYNSQYSNSGDGWKLYPGAYYSDSDISSYNGSLGLGFSKAGNTVSAPVAMSKPMPLVGDGAVIPTDVYSARAKVKVYSDSSSDTKFILTIAFLDSTNTRIGYRETFVTPDTSEDWQDVKVLGAGVPTGTSNIQIQFYTQGTLAHGMFVNPMLVKGPVVGPYQPDTIGMADVTGFATKTDLTTAISTATANMVDSSKATNFTAGLQSGGVNVATAADLKSIENSAWHRLDFGSDANLGGAVLSSYMVYQIHDDEKYLSFFYLGVSQSENKTFSDGTTLMDLSSIVKGISSIDFSTKYAEMSDNSGNAADFKISGTKIITSTNSHSIYVTPNSTVSLYPLNHTDRRIYYTELV